MAENLAIGLEELRRLFGERLSTSDAVREHHSQDESWHTPHAPDAVCFANDADEVSAALLVCNRHKVQAPLVS